MIGHVFRLAWNRRRLNALILTEVFVCFLVLCSLMTAVSWFTLNWMRPLGFDWHDVIQVEMQATPGDFTDETMTMFVQKAAKMRDEVAELPGVTAVTLMSNVPYSNSTNSTSTRIDGADRYVLYCPVTPEAREVLKLQLLSGRWIEPGDENLGWQPVVVTESLARGWFPGQDPLGQTVPEFDEHGNRSEPKPGSVIERVVGVVADYRREGEPAPTPLAEFLPASLSKAARNSPETLVIRLAPGTPAVFEADLVARLRQEEPDWSFQVDPLGRMRERVLKARLAPLWIGGAVALFLVFTVGLGLIGVLWQSVSRRTAELGVRRALGARAGDILKQVIGEILALTTIASAAGALLFVQVPIIRLLRDVPAAAFGFGIIEALVMLYLFVSLCGLYPGWLATRVQPAQALQHE